MKKLLLFLLLFSAYLVLPKNASAQYKSIFGEKNTSWSVVQCWNFVDGGDISDSFHTAGDTIIKNRNYKQIIVTDFWGRASIISFMREDTALGKVWIRYNTNEDTIEHLVMDMNLQVGDSIGFDFSYNGSISQYIVVDSVYSHNGLKHIRFSASTDCRGNFNALQKITFIEGIGSSAGLMKASQRSNLLCYYKDGGKAFTSEYFNGLCRIYIVGMEENNTAFTSLKLYPNPTNGSGIITLENPNNNCVNLEIYDLSGKQVFRNSSRRAYISFDINAFDKGIYIFKLMNEKGEFSSGRIIKQ